MLGEGFVVANVIRDVESALVRSPKGVQTGRYAVYLPGAVVLGTFARLADAKRALAGWVAEIPEVIIVDRRPGCVANPRTAHGPGR
jgi:hypothetical protein